MRFPARDRAVRGTSKHQPPTSIESSNLRLAREITKTTTMKSGPVFSIIVQHSDPSHLPSTPPENWRFEEDRSELHPFDLEERTARFGEQVIGFLKQVPLGPRNNRLIDQLVGCATSVGANYCEANEGVSKKDFRYIIGRCVKEAKESKYFLRMIAASEPTLAAEARPLFREATELHLIFASIFRKTRPSD